MLNFTLKRRITQGERLLGTWAQFSSCECIEILGWAGFDFGVIDLEHGSFGYETAEQLIRAANGAGLGAVVRVAENNSVMIMKALDMGAEAVLVPGISTVQDAKQAVAAAKYPPLGVRGACPFVRGGGQYVKDMGIFQDEQNNQTMVFILIEGQSGAFNFEEIIKVKGIDAVMTGPVDMSFALGVGGQLEHPLVLEQFAKMQALANERGIPMIQNVFNTDLSLLKEKVAHWFDLGASMVMVNGDKSMFAQAVKDCYQAVAELKIR